MLRKALETQECGERLQWYLLERIVELSLTIVSVLSAGLHTCHGNYEWFLFHLRNAFNLAEIENPSSAAFIDQKQTTLELPWKFYYTLDIDVSCASKTRCTAQQSRFSGVVWNHWNSWKRSTNPKAWVNDCSRRFSQRNAKIGCYKSVNNSALWYFIHCLASVTLSDLCICIPRYGKAAEFLKR